MFVGFFKVNVFVYWIVVSNCVVNLGVCLIFIWIILNSIYGFLWGIIIIVMVLMIIRIFVIVILIVISGFFIFVGLC